MFTFLHAADIHLDSPLHNLEQYDGAPVSEVRSACRRAFVNLIDTALDERVAFVVLAGDLYDGDWKDYNTGLFFIAQMRRLREAGILVFMVSGNHDAASRLTRNLRLPDNVHLFSHHNPESVRLDDRNAIIHGWSFPTRDVSRNMVLEFPAADRYCFNIGVLHTALSGRPGHEPYAPCSVDDLTNTGYDYWALGHVHQHEIVATDPWIVFPGNIQGRHIRESGAKGAVLVTVREGRVQDVEHRSLDLLRWYHHRFDAAGCLDEEALFAAASEVFVEIESASAGKSAAVRLEIVDYPHHVSQGGAQQEWLENELRAQSILHGDIWLEKVLFSSSKLLEQNNMPEDSPVGDLLREIGTLRGKPDALSDLLPDLKSFIKSLPPEYPDRDRLLLFDSTASDVLLDGVRTLLLDLVTGDRQ